MAKTFQKIRDEAERKGLEPFTKKSYNWYLKNLKNMTNVTERKILTDDNLLVRKKPLIGRMFMYGYGPKWAEKLEYYDTFPLIIMVGPAEGGFYGINLHYLNPTRRAAFFDILRGYATDKRYSQQTRLRMTYSMLKSNKTARAFGPCFKHYLKSHIRTKVVQVPPKEWQTALFLPTDNFQKADRSKVWRDTNRRSK